MIRFVPSSVKHLFTGLLGLLAGYCVVGNGVMHVGISATVVFYVGRWGNRKWMGIFVWIWSVGYLAMGHVWRQVMDPKGWELDFTILMMVAVVKQVGFIYSVMDGEKMKKDKDARLHKEQRVHEYFLSLAVHTYPSFLEYMSYIFFYATFLVGPPFDFRHFQKFMDGSLFRESNLKEVPSSILPTLQVVGYALIAYFFYAQAAYFPVLNGYVLTDEFLVHTSFAYRIGYLLIALTLVRCRYYFVWFMAEAAAVSSGISFNGVKDGVPRWDKLTNSNVLLIEFGRSFPEILSGWNINVSLWLKDYVYLRVETPKIFSFMGDKNFANLVTKMVAAIWHGFYSGYYVFFFLVAIANFADDEIRRVFRPLVFKDEKDEKGKFVSTPIAPYPVVLLFNVLTIAWTHFALAYVALAFVLSEVSDALLIWNSLYHVGLFVILGIWIGLRVFFPPKKAVKVHKEEEKAGAHKISESLSGKNDLLSSSLK